MKAIKFDEAKVINCIQAHFDQYEKYPYLIMSQKTANILPSDTVTSVLVPVDGIAVNNTWANSITIAPQKPKEISIDNEKYTRADTGKSPTVWHKCKVMIDNSMEFGEVHIG